MAVTRYADGSYFAPIRSGQICPICGSKKGRCSVFYNENGEVAFYRCKYKVSDKPSNGWYIHMASEIGSNTNYKPVNILPNVDEAEITEEILLLRDKVYRRFRELVKKYEGDYLHDEDKQDLLKRGLNEFQILRMGYFSVPTSGKQTLSDDGKHKIKVSTAIARDLESEFGNELLKVPGFIKRKSKSGNEYIAFKITRVDQASGEYKGIKGYFIPYISIEGLMVGLQYRLTEPAYDENGKQIRYLWYSSKQARSGSPVDYYIPSTVKRKDILLVTEGATKGRIASEILGFEGMFIAGVSNYRNLVKNIIYLEKVTGQRYKIITAYDMDKIDNAEVMAAEKELLSLLKGTGHQIAVAEWNRDKAKGIDDALSTGVKILYKLV